MNFYKLPVTGASHRRSPTWKFGSEKDQDFIEKARKAKAFVPAPGSYKDPDRWNQEHFFRMKGGPRTTFSEEMFKKMADRVPPNKYKVTRDAKDAPP